MVVFNYISTTKLLKSIKWYTRRYHMIFIEASLRNTFCSSQNLWKYQIVIEFYKEFESIFSRRLWYHFSIYSNQPKVVHAATKRLLSHYTNILMLVIMGNVPNIDYTLCFINIKRKEDRVVLGSKALWWKLFNAYN